MKLLVLDLDGTLLKDDKTIDPEMVKFLHHWKEKNKIIFSTARAFSRCEPWYSMIQPNGIIYNGGATVLYDHQIIYEAFMEDEKANSLFHDLKELNYEELLFEKEDGFYTTNISKIKCEKDHLITGNEEIHHLYKLSIICEEQEKIEKIHAKYPNFSFLKYNNESFYRFSNPLGNKGLALKRIMEYLNLEGNDVYCFGDDINDVDMFLENVNAIAMKNAIPELKKIANDVTEYDNNHMGIKQYLENKSIF